MGPNFPISRKLKRFKIFNSNLYLFKSKNISSQLSIQKYIKSFLNFYFQKLIISKLKYSYQNNMLNIKIFYYLDKNFKNLNIRKKKLQLKKRFKALGSLKNISNVKDITLNKKYDMAVVASGDQKSPSINNSSFTQKGINIPCSDPRSPNGNLGLPMVYEENKKSNNTLIFLINNIIKKKNNIEFLINSKNFLLPTLSYRNFRSPKGNLRLKKKWQKKIYLFFIKELKDILKLLITNKLNLNNLQIIEYIIKKREQNLLNLEQKLMQLSNVSLSDALTPAIQINKLSQRKRYNSYKTKRTIYNIKKTKFLLMFLKNMKENTIFYENETLLKNNIKTISEYKTNVKNREFYNDISDLNKSTTSKTLSKPILKFLENYLSFKLGIKTNIKMVRLESPLLNSHILAKYFSLNLKKHGVYYVWKKLNKKIKICNTSALNTKIKNNLILFKLESIKKFLSPLKKYLTVVASGDQRSPSVNNHFDLLSQHKKWFIIKFWMKNLLLQRITGIKLKISGRFNKRKGATKTRTQYYSKGTFKFNSIDSFIDYGSFERKDRNGTQTIKVSIAN